MTDISKVLEKPKIDNIEATYGVTTPMFCGGHKHKAELRLASFKGVLRFWWRALAWPRLKGDLDKIKEQEDRLFGSAAGGQAKVLMCLGAHDDKAPFGKGEILKDGQGTVGQGVRYFGLGVMEAFNGKNTKEGRLTKPCLPAPFSFTVQLRAKALSDDERTSLLAALKAVGLFGAMGAKSRKGYGSLSLAALTCNDTQEFSPITDLQGLESELQKLWSAPHDKWPAYTAFGKKTRVVVLQSRGSALAVLDKVGREEVRYRSWGRNGKVLSGEKAEKKFKLDHDLIKRCAGHDGHGKHPERIAFGLPHTEKIKPKDFDRRASPLFIHIHKLAGDGYAAVLTFLPAVFLPRDKDKIKVDRNYVELSDPDKLYKPVDNFLNRFFDDETRKKESFDIAKEVTCHG